MKSDHFFSINTDTYDLIFIDGLHEANQVLRDVENSLKILNKGGTILIHDCNPRTEQYQYRLDNPKLDMTLWTGDVWKAIVILRLNTNLEVIVGDFDMGLAIVRVRPNRIPLSDILLKPILDIYPLKEIVHQLPYTYLNENRKELLLLSTVADIEKWID